jgi:TatA/E family protein of Tat protein translocase
MLSVSPLKLVIVLVVALVLIGPDKLPGVARQLGAGWGAFRRVRQRIEDEVRDTVPDIPAAHQIAQAVRSPVAFLDSLADMHGQDAVGEEHAGESVMPEIAGSASDPHETGNGAAGGGSPETAGPDGSGGSTGHDGPAGDHESWESRDRPDGGTPGSWRPPVPGAPVVAPHGLRVPDDPSMN